MTKWPVSDPQALDELLELHVSARPTILDCTYGKGGVWGRLPIRQQVIELDIQPFVCHGSMDCLVRDHTQECGND